MDFLVRFFDRFLNRIFGRFFDRFFGQIFWNIFWNIFWQIFWQIFMTDFWKIFWQIFWTDFLAVFRVIRFSKTSKRVICQKGKEPPVYIFKILLNETSQKQAGNQDNRESVVPLFQNYLRWPFWTPLTIC